jgi:hypothetical protein
MCDAAPDSITVLSCGCVISEIMESDEKVMQYMPCHTNCPNVIAAILIACEEDVPVQFKEID